MPDRVPHAYQKSEPYRGCTTCGLGPGAAVHNESEVARFKAITIEDWDLIHDQVDAYYQRHSVLVNELLERLPPHAHAEFLQLANERNSVYGRDTKAK